MTSRGRIQAVVVVGLAAGLLNATAATMNRAVNTLEIVSYSLIVLIGLRLLWVKGRAFIAALDSLHRPAAVGAAVTPVHHDDSYHDETQHGHRVQAHHGHDHSREPHTLDCSCGHAHHHDHDYHASAWGHAHREPTWSFLAQIPHTKTKPEPRAGPCHFEPLVESGVGGRIRTLASGIVPDWACRYRAARSAVADRAPDSSRPDSGIPIADAEVRMTQPASQSLTHTESGRARNATKWGRFVHKDLVSVSSARSHRSSRTVGELSRRERLAGNADPVRPLRRPRQVRR